MDKFDKMIYRSKGSFELVNMNELIEFRNEVISFPLLDTNWECTYHAGYSRWYISETRIAECESLPVDESVIEALFKTKIYPDFIKKHGARIESMEKIKSLMLEHEISISDLEFLEEGNDGLQTENNEQRKG